MKFCFSQHQYKSVDKFVESKFKKNIIKDQENVSKYLPKGYVKDGTVDYSDFLQKAIEENKEIIFPNFPIRIDRGLYIPSNKVITFNEQSKIIFRGTVKSEKDDILIIKKAVNVKLFNIKIDGGRDYSKDFKGEWNAGISILNSHSILIDNFEIVNTLGDGIFIGSNDGLYSSSIVVKNGLIDNVRRNGISVTSVDGLDINNIIIANVNGTTPECGIDIEPSLNSEILNNIKISKIESFNNKYGALAINLSNFNSDNLKTKNVGIEIEDFKDQGSGNFVILSLNPLNKKNGVSGKIKLKKFKGRNIKSYGYWKDSSKTNVIIEKHDFSFDKN